MLASFRAVRPRVEPDPLNAKALRQRALVCCKGTLAALCLRPRASDKLCPKMLSTLLPGVVPASQITRLPGSGA
jgi:hypothetical protein